MAGRRLCYFGLLLGAVLFFLLYGQWLSAVVLAVFGLCFHRIFAVTFD